MAKLPVPKFPVAQLTTTELAAYIEELRETLNKDLTEAERDAVLHKLGQAYEEYNKYEAGAMPQTHENTHPHVIS